MMNVGKVLLGISLFMLLSTGLHAQFFENARNAFAKAESEHKPILLVFSGSDWCAPCIKLDKYVLSDSSFRTFANNNIVVLVAEFPQRKALTSEIINQNVQLAKQYNPRGQFPYIVLLDASGKVLSVLEYTNQPPSVFITFISKFLTQKSGNG